MATAVGLISSAAAIARTVALAGRADGIVADGKAGVEMHRWESLAAG